MKNKVVKEQREKTGFPKIHGWIYQFDSGLIKNLDVSTDYLENFHREWLTKKSKKTKKNEEKNKN